MPEKIVATENVATLPLVDLAIIVVYLAISVAVGAWFFRKTKSADDYMVGSRAMPGWVLGISIIGAYFSSISFVALPGKAYGGNWSAFVFSLSIPPVCWIAHKWFIPMYRHSLQISAYEHLEQRFGYWARAYSSVCLIGLQIIRTGIVLYLLALVIKSLLGWDFQTTIILLGLLTLVYTVMGGIEGVIWVDVGQTLVFIAGAIACCIYLIYDMPGGFGRLMEVAAKENKFSLGGFNFSLVTETFWVILIYGIMENVKNFGIDQNYVQRFIAASSDREARKSLWLGALAYIPVSAMFIFIGTALYAYYNTIGPDGKMVPAVDGLPAGGEAVFTYFIVHALPVGLPGLVVASLLATAMDTMAVNINTSATVWIADFYKRLINRNSSDAQQLSMARWSSMVIGLLGTLAGLVMVWRHIEKATILDIWWQISSILGGGMIGLFLLGILVKKATRRGAIMGTALGLMVIAWGTLCAGLENHPTLSWLDFPFHKNLIGVLGMLIIILIGWGETNFAPASPAKRTS